MRLAHRHVQPEIMDEPDLEAERHHAALRGLARLNTLSGSAGRLWGEMRDLARAEPPLHILDVATGGADVPIGLWRRARRGGLPLRLSACDVSPTALAFAERRARDAGCDVDLFPLDVCTQSPPDRYDVVVCSLFLHHLDEESAVGLLRRLATAARRRLLVNDLHRGATDLALVAIAARLVTRSDVVHQDATRSVRAAYTTGELRQLAARAGLDGATVRRGHPCRLLLRWEAS
ncbi:MAG: methyltransferase domain-containing protein [Planctomycetes bacterium]|nr:methyltransferase domain-containing protein [Planctomycetota bacterium]